MTKKTEATEDRPASRKRDLPAKVAEASLDEFRQRFEQGESAALFAALRFCGNQELVMPEWLVTAFFKATNRWYSLECKTLDEAFCVPRKDGDETSIVPVLPGRFHFRPADQGDEQRRRWCLVEAGLPAPRRR
jgi:hypothetical protein